VQLYDAVIIGAGHNGLTCAAYLGMAGLQVKVLERRHVIGGAAVTEEFYPGFRNSIAAYAISLLNSKVIRDLRLHEHGLRIVERCAQNFLPTLNGQYLLFAAGDPPRDIAEISKADAERYGEFARNLDRCADVLRDLVLRAPPNLTEGFNLNSVRELINASALFNRLRRIPHEELRKILDFLTKSAADILNSWFENDLVKALIAFDAIVGNFASPYAAGTAYGLLHHAFGDVNGKKRAWGHALGGMGAVTQAMAKAAQTHGVDIETNAPVCEILFEKQRTRGVVVADGRVFHAPIVAANVNPRLLYTSLIAESLLAPEFFRRMRHWRCESGTFRMNVALSQLPNVSALPGDRPAAHHIAGIIIAPSLSYMDIAHADARRFGWSREPIIEMLVPSTLDESLAPAGAHVASLFCQHVAPKLPDAMSWRDQRDTVAELMIDTVDRYAPGFKASVLGYQALSPVDLEEMFGLIGGDIFHGAQSLDQLFWARPMLGHANYRGPLKGLYHCGSGAHPGGGVTGAPGHNAARAILFDNRWGRIFN
jgi:phytoene dehydrogenase-like protein